mgnify:CR=1 FL=1
MESWTIRNSPHAATIAAAQRAALAAVEPGAAVRRHVRREGNRLLIGGQTYDPEAADRPWVVGGGRAAAPLAAAPLALAWNRHR